MRAPDALTPGLQRAPPGMAQFQSSILFRQNNICMSAALGYQNGATTVATEVLIAQLQSYLLRRDVKIETFDTKSKF
jgi:hypothetical protein